MEIMAWKASGAIPNSIPENDHPLPENLGKSYEALVVSEVQLLLAEKCTSLAAMRTGIVVFVLPLSVLSVLIATSRYYHFIYVLYTL